MTPNYRLASGLLLGMLTLSTSAFAQSSGPLFASTPEKCASGGRSGDGIAVFRDKIVLIPGVYECVATSGAFSDSAASSTVALRCNLQGEIYTERRMLQRSGDGATLVSEDGSTQGLMACPAPRAAAPAAASVASAASTAADATPRVARRRGGRIAGALARAIPKLLTGDRSDILGTVTGAVSDAVAEAGPGRAGAIVGAVAGAVGAAADGRHMDAVQAAAGAIPGRAGAVVGAVTDAASAVADGRTGDAVSAVAGAVASTAPRASSAAAPAAAAAAAPRAAAPQVYEVTGSLEHGMPEFDDGSYYDEYGIEVVKGIRYTFELISDDFDAYLLVEGPSIDLENDDAHDNTTHARISFVAPESGDYLVTVTSYDGGEIGDYVLRARF